MASDWAPAFEQAVQSFDQYGFWYVLLAGFSPVPYKVFTISAGAVGMPVMPFLIGSLAGRGGRFYLVAGLIRLGGESFAVRLRAWIDILGWVAIVAVLIGLGAWKILGNGH